MAKANHHILPFFIPHQGCPHRCSFCDQQQIAGAQAPSAEEISQAIAGFPEEITPEVAFYGGSFTALPEKMQEYYLAPAYQGMRQGRVSGIRVSTRPDAITQAGLDLLSAYGVHMVELGVQSLEDQVLLEAKRGHDAAASFVAAALLKERGFAWGVQLLPGLPGENWNIALERCAHLLAMQPDTARLYPALVIAGTLLAQQYQQGAYQPLTLEEAVERCCQLRLLCETYGVQVIRTGLQNTEEMQLGKSVIAGPFHPAFGDLVKGKLLLWQAFMLLADAPCQTLLVANSDLASFIGQKRRNLQTLLLRYPTLCVERANLAPGTLATDTGALLTRQTFVERKLADFPFELPDCC